MALSFAIRVANLSCKVFKNTQQTLKFVNQFRTVKMPLTPASSVHDSARSYWSVCNKANTIFNGTSQTKLHKKCCRCGLHTEGDKELSNFLEKEIGVESSSDRFVAKVPEITDWKVTTDVSDITMSKVLDGETISIKFNVVDSVNEEGFGEDAESESDNQTTAQMTSKPPFTVEIKKASGKVMCLKCSFPLDDMDDYDEGEIEEQLQQEQEQDDGMTDKFQIDEVSLYENTKSEAAYSVLSSTMDGTLYDLLMDYLDDRGISNEFIDTLVDYSTHYEQRLYVTFLKDMKAFLDEK